MITAAQETSKVKTALRAIYPGARVSHGTGTASSWLHLKIEAKGPGKECYCAGYPTRCTPCVDTWQHHYQAAIAIAQRVTGRSGKYNGNINADVRLV